MTLPAPIKRFAKANYKKTFLWILTFFIASSFVLSSIQINSTAVIDSGGDTAAEIYITSQEGVWQKYINAGIYSIMDWPADNSNVKFVQDSNQQTGAVQAIGNATYLLYTEPPASGLVWAQNEVNKIQGLESITAHAQSDPNDSDYYYPGLGYNVLQPVITLWQWSRNIVYFIFIIIMIVIAFMVLFRTSMGGQTLVTISNSLPSIMWALLLVTLSYPISGLAIDMITIGSGFLQSVLITAPNAPGSSLVDSKLIYPNDPAGRTDINFLQPDDPEMSLWLIWGTSDAKMCQGAGCEDLRLIPNAAKSQTIFGTMLEALNMMTSGISNYQNASGLFTLLLAIAVLQAALKLFLALLKEYAYLILIPIVSPFIFLTAAFPTKTGTVLWKFVLGLLKSSLSFVAVYGVFLFMVILGRGSELDTTYSGLSQLNFTPPLLGYSDNQVIGGGNVIIPILLYLLFMFTPNIPELLGNALQAPKANEFFSKSMRGAGSSAMAAGRGAWSQTGGAIKKKIDKNKQQ